MKEKDFSITFNHWLKAKHRQTGAFELKLARGVSLPYSAVVPHQIEALLNAKHGVLVHKIVDCGYQNPFDTYCLSGVSAYVVIKFSGGIYLIDIDDFVRTRDSSSRKSITEDEANLICAIKI